MQTKKIKVLYSSRQSKSKSIYGGDVYHFLPKIQMEGKWLEALGFHIGDALQIEYAEGEIRIRPLSASQPAQLQVCEASDSYLPSAKNSAPKARH